MDKTKRIEQEEKELKARQEFAAANPGHPTAAKWAEAQQQFINSLKR